MWLLLLVLIAGIWNTTDAAISIAARLPDIDDYRGMTTREKVEFAGRIIRGLFGWTLLIVAFLWRSEPDAF